MSIFALAGGLLGLGEGIINRAHQKKINNQNIDNQWKMWNASNEYNTPLEQRRRMEAAGFNPNMMYGHGTVANTSTPQTLPKAESSPTNVTDATSKGFLNYFETKMRQAQIDNAETQNELLQAQIRKTNREADMLDVNYDINSDQDVIDSKKLIPVLQRQLLHNNVTMSANQASRSAERIANELKIQLGTIKQQGATLSNLELENELKRTELQLRKNGLSWSDPVLLRMLAQALPPGTNLQEIIKNLKLL